MDILEYVNGADSVRHLRRGDCMEVAGVYGSIIEKTIVENPAVAAKLNYADLWQR